jgi:hypothetical protein
VENTYGGDPTIAIMIQVVEKVRPLIFGNCEGFHGLPRVLYPPSIVRSIKHYSRGCHLEIVGNLGKRSLGIELRNMKNLRDNMQAQPRRATKSLSITNAQAQSTGASRFSG